MAQKWEFSTRFRRSAFGWRSQLPVQRIKEAVREIKAAARKDKALGAEGAVLFLEKLAPAIENVDSSSGAIGTATNRAIDELVAIIADAPADAATRSNWLDRLWKAVEADGIGYLDEIPENWGRLCASQTMASYWADVFIEDVRFNWGDEESLGGYYVGTSACLSCLFHSGRYTELLELLNLSPNQSWHYRIWGTKALAATGRPDEAIRFAYSSRDAGLETYLFAATCEEILLSQGKIEEALYSFAVAANRRTTGLASFKAIIAKYPGKTPEEILTLLVDESPGHEGRWFAAAKSAGLLEEAAAIAEEFPTDPITLTRAARDFLTTNPGFSVKAGYAATRWLLDGYGHDILPTDIIAACTVTLLAAEQAGCLEEVKARMVRLIESPFRQGSYVAKLVQFCLREKEN